MPKRSIDSDIHNRGKYQKLSPHAKLLWYYAITSCHGNAAGLYHITLRTIAQELSGDGVVISKEEIPELFEELKALDIVYYDDAEVLWVKNFLRHQTSSPKFLAGVAKALDGIARSHQELVEEYLDYNNGIEIPFEMPPNTEDTGQDKEKEKAIPGEQLASLKGEFPDIDITEELKRFTLYWQESNKELKRPKSAFRNWLLNARKFKQEGKSAKATGRFPTHYTRPEDI